MKKVLNINKFYGNNYIFNGIENNKSNKVKIYLNKLNIISAFIKEELNSFQNRNTNTIQFEKRIYLGISSFFKEEYKNYLQTGSFLILKSSNQKQDSQLRVYNDDSRVKNSKRQIFNYVFRLFYISNIKKELKNSILMSEVNVFLLKLLLVLNGLSNSSYSYFNSIDGLYYFLDNNHVNHNVKLTVNEIIYKNISSLSFSIFNLLSIIKYASSNRMIPIFSHDLTITEDFLINTLHSKVTKLKKKNYSLSFLYKVLTSIDSNSNNNIHNNRLFLNSICLIIYKIFPLIHVKPRQVSIENIIYINNYICYLEWSIKESKIIEQMEKYLFPLSEESILSSIQSNLLKVKINLHVYLDYYRIKDGVVRGYKQFNYSSDVILGLIHQKRYSSSLPEGYLDRLYHIVEYSYSQKVSINYIYFVKRMFEINKVKFYPLLTKYMIERYNSIVDSQFLSKITIEEYFLMRTLNEYQFNNEIDEIIKVIDNSRVGYSLLYNDLLMGKEEITKLEKMYILK